MHSYISGLKHDQVWSGNLPEQCTEAVSAGCSSWFRKRLLWVITRNEPRFAGRTSAALLTGCYSCEKKHWMAVNLDKFDTVLTDKQSEDRVRSRRLRVHVGWRRRAWQSTSFEALQSLCTEPLSWWPKWGIPVSSVRRRGLAYKFKNLRTNDLIGLDLHGEPYYSWYKCCTLLTWLHLLQYSLGQTVWAYEVRSQNLWTLWGLAPSRVSHSYSSYNFYGAAICIKAV